MKIVCSECQFFVERPNNSFGGLCFAQPPGEPGGSAQCRPDRPGCRHWVDREVYQYTMEQQRQALLDVTGPPKGSHG